MQEPPERISASGDAVQTRDEELHGVSSSVSARHTEVGQVRTQRSAPEEIPADMRGQGYEATDVNVRSIVYVIIGLIAAIAASGAFVGGILFVLLDREDTASISAVSRAILIPPEPRLQITPQADRKALEEAAHTRLSGYGGTSERGRVRIPIERAMELLAAHGWPDPDEQSASARDRTVSAKQPEGTQPRTLQRVMPQERPDLGAPSIEAPP